MRVALVTGASRGLGAEMARQLAAAGWAVAVNYAQDNAGAGAVRDSVVGAGGHAALARFDITDEAAVRQGIAAIARDLGPVDLIVNNATGPQPVMPIAEQEWVHYQDQIDFFLKAPVLLLRAVLEDWRSRKVGRIINIGSEVVAKGSAHFAHYVAAKAGMIGLTRSWANELGPEGITVNLVVPGWTPVERHAGTSQAELDAHMQAVPLRRMGHPSDVAGMVVYLASSQADFITGQAFSVNGGRTFA